MPPRLDTVYGISGAGLVTDTPALIGALVDARTRSAPQRGYFVRSAVSSSRVSEVASVTDTG